MCILLCFCISHRRSKWNINVTFFNKMLFTFVRLKILFICLWLPKCSTYYLYRDSKQSLATDDICDNCLFSYLADSFHSSSSPSCCSVSISVKRVGVGMDSSSSPSMYRNRSAAGDTLKWRERNWKPFSVLQIYK